MNQTANSRAASENAAKQNSENKQYPGIVVECYGTLADITQNSFIGVSSDGILGTPFGGSGS